MAPPTPAPSHDDLPHAASDALDVDAIRDALVVAWANAGLGGIDLDVVASTGSTNTDLIEAARHTAPKRPRVRIALAQTAGRGRRGRQWEAPAGSALLMSVAQRWPGAQIDGAVTLACGVAVAEALRAMGVPAGLKWPNDVLLHGRKLAGLLAELAVDAAGARTLVLGLGVNLAPVGHYDPPRAAVHDALPQRSLATLHRDCGVTLARAVLQAMQDVARDGFADFAERFDALFAWRGRPVIVFDPLAVSAPGGPPPVTGQALGVDAIGRLRVLAGDQVITVNSGELSLRAAANADDADETA